MSTDDLLAVFPALSSHKGTPVRFILSPDSEDKFVVEPLRYNAGGLVLKAEEIAGLLPTVDKETSPLSLLGQDGRIVKEPQLSEPTPPIAGIEAFVIYPSGATWEGRILEGKEDQCSMLIWSWELGHRLDIDNKEIGFGLGLAWPDVPTTVGVLSGRAADAAGCAYIEHTCHDCFARAKFL